MGKKRLNTTGIINDLEHSSFFSSPQRHEKQQSAPAPLPQSMSASKEASADASTLAAPSPTPLIETIRKSVKQIGKEVADPT